MTRELILLRHGKSDWSRDLPDFDRPLKERGKRSAQRMGVWLAQHGLKPDHVVSSPAARAIATARRAVKAMGRGAHGVKQDKRIYEAGVSTLLRVLAGCPEDSRRVMMVGHNPGFEYLLMHLTDGEAEPFEDGKMMPTAALAHLRMPDDWSDLAAGCGELRALVRPDTLPDSFPYPASGGEERRERPAHFYRQSAVIPYRISDGSPEVLVMLSKKKKRFVLPTGIRDPELPSRESAAREAWEEAGVEGRLSDEPIGFFEYEKWGGTCRVDVYGLEVMRSMPDAEWDISHPPRQWVKPKQAIRQLKQPQLAPLVKKFIASLKGT